jgi:hypothetical protein
LSRGPRYAAGADEIAAAQLAFGWKSSAFLGGRDKPGHDDLNSCYQRHSSHGARRHAVSIA